MIHDRCPHWCPKGYSVVHLHQLIHCHEEEDIARVCGTGTHREIITGRVAETEIVPIYFAVFRDDHFSVAGEHDRGGVDVLGPADDHARWDMKAVECTSGEATVEDSR